MRYIEGAINQARYDDVERQPNPNTNASEATLKLSAMACTQAAARMNFQVYTSEPSRCTLSCRDVGDGYQLIVLTAIPLGPGLEASPNTIIYTPLRFYFA
jgi:hypothetical protein